MGWLILSRQEGEGARSQKSGFGARRAGCCAGSGLGAGLGVRDVGVVRFIEACSLINPLEYGFFLSSFFLLLYSSWDWFCF